MTAPSDVLDHIQRALEDNGGIPSSVSYLTHEADSDGADADVKLPIVQITPVSSARIRAFNTDKVGYTTDNNGNQTGIVYDAEYEMMVQVDVLSVDDRTDSAEEIDPLTNSVRTALYEYDSAGPGKLFEDSDGNPDEDVWQVELDEGERADDTAMTPPLRRWSQDLTVWANEEFKTTEDYITAVDLPDEDAVVQ